MSVLFNQRERANQKRREKKQHIIIINLRIEARPPCIRMLLHSEYTLPRRVAHSNVEFTGYYLYFVVLHRFLLLLLCCIHKNPKRDDDTIYGNGNANGNTSHYTFLFMFIRIRFIQYTYMHIIEYVFMIFKRLDLLNVTHFQLAWDSDNISYFFCLPVGSLNVSPI